MKSRQIIFLSVLILLLLQGFTAFNVNGQAAAGAGTSKEVALGGNVFKFQTIIRKNTPATESKSNKSVSSKNKQSSKGGKTTAKASPKQMPKPKNSADVKQTAEEKEDVEVGKVIELPKPVYPKAASAVGATGLVEVSVTIDEKGNVVSAEAISGHPLLKAAAVEAAKQAKFTPTLLNKEPVMVTGVLAYNFTK